MEAPKLKLTDSEKSKLYRQRNPERWKHTIKSYHKKKWTCQCGAIVCNKVRPQHLRSTKHKERMELINKYKSSSDSEDTSSS
tara:strand:- start:7891 stop:8136 length:246 start_codon:yes stop_codon:yes gene_type:complete